MKKSITTIAIAATLALSAASTSVNATSSADQLFVNICQSVADDNKGTLRKVMSKNKVKARSFYGSLKCNNLSILRFAMSKNATETGKWLTRKLSRNSLSKPEDDGVTIESWASSNGYTGTDIAKAINERING